MKVIQWDRYSFENYLLNDEIIYNTLQDIQCDNPPKIRATFSKNIKKMAFEQIEKENLHANYGKYLPQTLSLSTKEISSKNENEIATLLADKLNNMKDFFNQKYNKTTWKQNFIEGLNKSKVKMLKDWETKWISCCKGKVILGKIHKKHKVKENFSSFILQIVKRIVDENTEEFNLVKDKVVGCLKK